MNDQLLKQILDQLQELKSGQDSLHAKVDRIEAEQTAMKQAIFELKDDVARIEGELSKTSQTTAYLSRDLYLRNNQNKS